MNNKQDLNVPTHEPVTRVVSVPECQVEEKESFDDVNSLKYLLRIVTFSRVTIL